MFILLLRLRLNNSVLASLSILKDERMYSCMTQTGIISCLRVCGFFLFFVFVFFVIDQSLAYRTGGKVQTATLITHTSFLNRKLNYMVGNDVAILDGIFRYP